MEQDVDLLTSTYFVHRKAGPEGSLNSAQPCRWVHHDPSKCQETSSSTPHSSWPAWHWRWRHYNPSNCGELL